MGKSQPLLETSLTELTQLRSRVTENSGNRYASTSATDVILALTRYNSDGSLDNTFDADGKVTTDFGNSQNLGHAIAIQSDGKIIVAGSTMDAFGQDVAMARYNTNGSLDNTFDADGKSHDRFRGR